MHPATKDQISRIDHHGATNDTLSRYKAQPRKDDASCAFSENPGSGQPRTSCEDDNAARLHKR